MIPGWPAGPGRSEGPGPGRSEGPGSALLEVRLGSGWLEDRSARIGSARYGFIRARISSSWLSSGLCSELGLVRLSSGSGLGSCVAG